MPDIIFVENRAIHLKKLVFLIVISIFYMSSCKSKLFDPLVVHPIDITKKGIYKSTFSTLNSNYIIPYIIVSNDKANSEYFGEPIEDSTLKLKLTIRTNENEIVFQQNFDNKSITEGSWHFPNTTLVMIIQFENDFPIDNKDYISIFEIVEPTNYYGNYGVKFYIDPPEKYR